MRALRPRLEKLETAHLAEQRAARARCVRRLLDMLSRDELLAWMAWYEARQGSAQVDAETEAQGLAVVEKWTQALTPAEIDLFEWAATFDREGNRSMA